MRPPSLTRAPQLPPAADTPPPPSRVIGRLDDLDHHRQRRRPGEQSLGDVLARWSLDGNREWLIEGVQREEPFLQISHAPAGSVLEWEIRQLQAEGYLGVGPLWVPARWLRDPVAYRRTVRLVANHVLQHPGPGAPVYVPKAHAELEPLLAMWPYVLVLPTSEALTPDDLIAARAWPVHPLGVVTHPTAADGQLLGPAEFFCHDLDHARFKVREDLRARGIEIPDAYREGSTLDAAAGVHRTLLPGALPHVDGSLWRASEERATRVAAWRDAIGRETDPALRDAARWLLFELVHEKSLPIEPGMLAGALRTDGPVCRLQRKCERGFYGDDGPSRGSVARLPSAREWLLDLMETTP